MLSILARFFNVAPVKVPRAPVFEFVLGALEAVWVLPGVPSVAVRSVLISESGLLEEVSWEIVVTEAIARILSPRTVGVVKLLDGSGHQVHSEIVWALASIPLVDIILDEALLGARASVVASTDIVGSPPFLGVAS